MACFSIYYEVPAIRVNTSKATYTFTSVIVGEKKGLTKVGRLLDYVNESMAVMLFE